MRPMKAHARGEAVLSIEHIFRIISTINKDRSGGVTTVDGQASMFGVNEMNHRTAWRYSGRGLRSFVCEEVGEEVTGNAI